MAVAQILLGISRLAQSPAHIRPYFAHTVWGFILFTFIFLVWWATWEFRSIDWTFPKYGYMLIAPTLMFFACSLLIPQNLDDNEVDLAAHFFRIRKPLFWSFFLASVASVIDGNVLVDEAIWHEGRPGHLTILIAGFTGIYTTNRRAHNAIAVIVALGFAFVVVVRFWSPR